MYRIQNVLYDVTALKKKAQRLYESGEIFRAFVSDVQLFPYTMKLKKPTQKDLLVNLDRLHKEIKTLESIAWIVEYKEFAFKSLGRQKLPISVSFQTQKEYLFFLSKTKEFLDFCRLYEIVVTEFAALKTLFLQKPQLLLQNRERVDSLLKVSYCFLKNPQPNIYLRELDIEGVDTKFIQDNRAVVDSFLSTLLKVEHFKQEIHSLSNSGFEKKYGLKYELPLVRFRVLDSALYIAGMDDISVTTEEFNKLNITCKNVFIVENKITMLSFMDVENSLVIFGNGYGVGMVKNAQWLQSKNIYYWGDIDMDGMAILSQARSYFPLLISLCMDNKTVDKYKQYAVKSKNKPYKKLANLTQSEQLLYARLYNDYYGENFRLEQERIPLEYVEEKLHAFR